jgi:hypothetical protein
LRGRVYRKSTFHAHPHSVPSIGHLLIPIPPPKGEGRACTPIPLLPSEAAIHHLTTSICVKMKLQVSSRNCRSSGVSDRNVRVNFSVRNNAHRNHSNFCLRRISCGNFFTPPGPLAGRWLNNSPSHSCRLLSNGNQERIPIRPVSTGQITTKRAIHIFSLPNQSKSVKSTLICGRREQIQCACSKGVREQHHHQL